jgi:hypothetical protein
MTEQEYFDNRVEEQISWYDNKSSSNKKWFMRLKIIETILALLIPLLTGYITTEKVELKVIVGLIGVMVAAITNIITLLKFQENWIKYRTTAENLKHEKFLYITKAGPYKSESLFPNFVEKFEGYICQRKYQLV